jgi:transposase
MAQNFKRMDQIRTIIRDYLHTRSYKKTSRRLNVSRNTVKSYIKKCNQSKFDYESILSLSDTEFKSIIYPELTQKEISRRVYFESQIDNWLSELRRVGVTRQLLWVEYKEQTPDGYGYSQFCDRLKKQISSRNLTIALNHQAGEKIMVDYAGKKIPWIDSGGKRQWAEVLVAVLPHSQYTFAIAVQSQKIADFIHGLNKTLVYFGGVPQVLLSDNLKSYVTKADRYEPKFTELCEQLAVHYDLTLEATRVAKPKDKASVEGAVSIVYKRLYAPLRNKEFTSIAQINESLLEQLNEHNSAPYQKRQGTRLSIYQTYELPLLKPLPSSEFEIKKTIVAKVQNNYHVFIGESKNYYSVPHRYAGQKVQVVYTRKMVEVYLKGKRIAFHPWLDTQDQYQYSTQKNHMPKNHQIHEEIRKYKDEHFLEKANNIGQNTHWAMNYILTFNPNKKQSYRACLGILNLSKTYSVERLDKACLRCKQVNKANYSMIKNILKHKLDLQVVHTELPLPVVNHDNIRGNYY